MNQKIVFFDIDGTLLDNKKKLSITTKHAIKKLKENNIIIAVATGRTPVKIQWLLDELEIDSYVAINGQYVIYKGREIYKNTLDFQFLEDISEFAEIHKHPLAYVSLEGVKATVENHQSVKNVYEPAGMSYPDIEKRHYQYHEIYQLLLFIEKIEEKMYIEKYQDHRFVRWHKNALDVLPLESSKATGIKKILKSANVLKENTYAFGDDINDIEMFSLVSTSVAMGNAIQPLKEISDFVTTSNEEDGILNGLKHLKLI